MLCMEYEGVGYGQTIFKTFNEQVWYYSSIWTYVKLGEIDNNFCVTARASRDLDDGKCGKQFGHCGIALFWNMSIASNVKSLDKLGSDRICAIKIMFDTHNVVIVSVYMPHKNSVLSDYDNELLHLQEIANFADAACSQLIILGDFIAHFGERIQKNNRLWGINSVNATKLTAFVEQNDLVMHDLSPECTGPNYTFEDSRGNRSYIDPCVVRSSMVGNANIKSFVYGVVSGISTSDHLAINISFSYFSTSLNNGRNKFREKIKWHRCDMSYIKQQ